MIYGLHRSWTTTGNPSQNTLVGFLTHWCTRLRVPRYGAILEFLNFAVLLFTFILCLFREWYFNDLRLHNSSILHRPRFRSYHFLGVYVYHRGCGVHPGRVHCIDWAWSGKYVTSTSAYACSQFSLVYFANVIGLALRRTLAGLLCSVDVERFRHIFHHHLPWISCIACEGHRVRRS